MRILRQIKNEVGEAKREFREKVITLILGGFGLVTALKKGVRNLFIERL